ncbi:MAG TPA: hypothetical protein VFA07_18440 [Chthonomonadaceae bacterium]|nr:hypothetical protein [Chthonomonadaceae bacterium]
MEEELLQQINADIPDALKQRYEVLIARRRAEVLTSEEYNELLELTDQVERIQAHRVQCLVELARLRHTSLTVLMEQLGISPPEYR